VSNRVFIAGTVSFLLEKLHLTPDPKRPLFGLPPETSRLLDRVPRSQPGAADRDDEETEPK